MHPEKSKKDDDIIIYECGIVMQERQENYFTGTVIAYVKGNKGFADHNGHEVKIPPEPPENYPQFQEAFK